jgi:hypothetical protein
MISCSVGPLVGSPVVLALGLSDDSSLGLDDGADDVDSVGPVEGDDIIGCSVRRPVASAVRLALGLSNGDSLGDLLGF